MSERFFNAEDVQEILMKGGENMAVVYCLLVPLAVLAVMVIGYGLFTVLFRTIRPLDAWAEKQRELMQWDDDEEDEE